MKTYRYNPETHAITVRKSHDTRNNPQALKVNEVYANAWAWTCGVCNIILRHAVGKHEAAKYWYAMGKDFAERIRPGAHWEITFGDGQHMGELDTWLAIQRAKEAEATA